MPSLTNYYFWLWVKPLERSRWQFAARNQVLRLRNPVRLLMAHQYKRICKCKAKSESDFVLGEIFTLSQQDIDYLDIYESVEEGMYEKFNLSVETSKGTIDCLVYIASDSTPGIPQEEYIERINLG